jgi:hypothetical protein
MCLELRGKANEDPTFTHISRIITDDKIWIYSYDTETKWYLTALGKMTSTVLLKHGKNDGIVVYVPKETILKDMGAKI